MGQTLTFAGANTTDSYTVRDRINTLFITIDAPSGGSATAASGSPGSGGRIVVALDVTAGEVITVYLADAGGDGSDETAGTGGATPLSNASGGAGGDGESGGTTVGTGGGGGGGATGVENGAGDQAVADGGGGQGGELIDADAGGGGGGGRGGAGGTSTGPGANDGSAGSGTGNGGAGGDGADSWATAQTGADGGSTADAAYTIQSQTTGGSAHASAGWVEIVEGGPTSVTLGINTVAAPGITLDLSSSSDAAGYYVYRSTSSGFSPDPGNRIADVTRSGSSQTYEDTTVDDGTTYYYRAEAYNSDGIVLSAEWSATTTLTAPTNVTATNVTDTTADVGWTDHATGNDGYRVLASTDGGSTWSAVADGLAAGAGSATVTGLRNGEEYLFTVEAYTADATARALESA